MLSNTNKYEVKLKCCLSNLNKVTPAQQYPNFTKGYKKTFSSFAALISHFTFIVCQTAAFIVLSCNSILKNPTYNI